MLGKILAIFEIELMLSAGQAVMTPSAAASRSKAVPNCSSTKMPALSLGTPAASADRNPS
jgi:hypothetical protein